MQIEYASKLVCEVCGRKSMGAFVRSSSFFYSCLSCKSPGPVTGFSAIKRSMTGSYEAFEVDSDLRIERSIFSGDICDGMSTLEREISAGKTVLLRRIV